MPGEQLTQGRSAYRRTSFALFLAGFSTFSLLYCVQPLLPEFSHSFGVDPATSSLSLSLSTGALAFAIVAAGAFSRRFKPRRLIFVSMMSGALLNIAAALAPGWYLMLAVRLVEGFVLGGVPAVAMSYLGERIEPRDLGRAMGLYIAGTAFGAMMGRVGMGLLAHWTSWRAAMLALGLVDLATSAGFALLLPAVRTFRPGRSQRISGNPHGWRKLLLRRDLLRLFAIGFILTSVSVSLYNYAGYRLAAAPYGLSQAQISLIFLTFLFGMFASSWAGRLSDRFGCRVPLAVGLAVMAIGVAITLGNALPLIIAGLSLVTIGFFIAHSVASTWVGRLAGDSKGQAAALYLLLYYAGSSVTGSIAGWFWQRGGWASVGGLTGALALSGFVLALSMRREPALS